MTNLFSGFLRKKKKLLINKLIKDIMENALFIDVPLEVDGGFGRDWYSAK